MTTNQKEQSPCKECENHKFLFPSCMDSCKKLSNWQSKRIRSFDHHIKYDFEDLESFQILI